MPWNKDGSGKSAYTKKSSGFKMNGIDFGEGTGRNLDFGERNSMMQKKNTEKKQAWNKPSKSQIDLWKEEFMALDDPMESNRGAELANKLMDAGVDPSIYDMS